MILIHHIPDHKVITVTQNLHSFNKIFTENTPPSSTERTEIATFRIVPYTKDTDIVDFGEEPIYFENFARNARDDKENNELSSNPVIKSVPKSEETATFRIVQYPLPGHGQ